MPDLMEQMYSSHQINIPPNLPFILKQYAKAAIRTQPYDLLVWSAAYFRAKANNTQPPVKDRLEYPPVDTPSRLSPGFLKVLHKQLGMNEFVNPDVLYDKWQGVCLVKEALDSMLQIGNMRSQIPWLKFLAIAAGNLCPSLSKTMVMICEILTEEPEGGSAMIPVEIFVNLYQFLAELDCGPEPPKALLSPDLHGSENELTPSGTSPSLPIKDKLLEKEIEMIGDVDSCAGLMIWDDIKPDVVPERVQSPKASSEIGHDSEAGLEVLSKADTNASDMVTLYPPQLHQQSTYSIHCSAMIHSPKSAPISIISSTTDETCISHSSLKENDDWIKIDLPNLSDDLKKEDIKSDALEHTIKPTAEIPEEQTTSQDIVSQKQNEENELITDTKLGDTASHDDKVSQEKLVDASHDNKVSQEKVVDDSTEEATVVEPAKSEEGSKDQINEDDKTQHDEFELQDNVMQPEAMPSEDTIFLPGESVTVQNFHDENEGSMVSYSTVEIRKGVLGDKSGDKIERASSENTVKAAETVHNIDIIAESSSNLLTSEQSSKGNSNQVASQSVKDISTIESESIISLPPEKPWRDVPGIGPVIPYAQVLAVMEYMQYWAAKQEGMVMPRNINHILCPPLDLPPSDLGQ